MNPSIVDTETQLAGDILIVDDTLANLRLLSDMLVEQGYKVRLAPNGKLALIKSNEANPQNEKTFNRPDGALLPDEDIMFMKKHGLARCSSSLLPSQPSLLRSKL